MFTDIDKYNYPELIKNAAQLGLIGGYPDGSFRPGDPATREEIALMLLRIVKMQKYDWDRVAPKLANQCFPSVVMIHCGGNIGSGYFVAGNKVLTNWHVIKKHLKENAAINVELHNGLKVLKCKVLKFDEGIDLTLIQLKEKMTSPGKVLPLATSVVKGEPSLVLGHPLGQPWTVAGGIVTYVDKWYVQTDALINPGNSGGVCINSHGEVVGVPTRKANLTAVDNFNFCIPFGKIEEFLK